MKSVMSFVFALPLSVELLGALFSVGDNWRDAGSRAAALERLTAPLLLCGGFWWLVGVAAWKVLLSALLVVLLCEVITFYGAALIISRPRLQTTATDTDAETR